MARYAFSKSRFVWADYSCIVLHLLHDDTLFPDPAIQSLVLNGVHMVAVHNRQPPDVHGIHHCANGFCNKSVEQPSLRAGMLVQVQHAVSFGARRGTGSGRGRG